MENFNKFIKYYGKRRKLKLFGFFIMSVIAGLLEFIGIALLYPFILLIVNPDDITHNNYYLLFEQYTKIDNATVNAFIIGGVVILLFIIKNLFMIFNLYLQNRFANNWKTDINKKIMKYYLFSSYKEVLKKPASEKLHTLLTIVVQAIDAFILKSMNLFTNITIVIIILALLLIKFPAAAITTGIFVGLSMFLQSKFFKKKTSFIASKRYKISASSHAKTVQNIENIKELKILSAENFFFKDYAQTLKELNNLEFKNSFYLSIPPYIVEILIVFALFILAGIISFQNLENSSAMIASYAIIVAAIFRIAPALNRIQNSINSMNSSRNFVKALIDEFEESKLKYVKEKNNLKIAFKHQIVLKDIFFSYVEDNKIIKGLNVTINKGEFIGIIGGSGAGKTTLADILMGLLPIDKGTIRVDETKLNEKNFSALRKLIGYVPQQINILDASFRKNVAWGIEENKIDDKQVKKALKQAQLLDFVDEFKDGIYAKATVGTNGLSQGQKQRLAIARALYRDPQIIIFDEATSSLDVETEHEITQMLLEMKGKKTIIAIAHRLSTLKNCDKLIYIKEGRIVDIGGFSELSGRHKGFEKLIKLSSIENS
jgi:ABC-type multidrug transport system fused ATPase/permease subunit